MKWFSIDRRPKQKAFWIRHIDGASFRTLGHEHNLTATQIYNRVKAEMDQLPENTWISARYCNRWSGILNVDGKYIKVKGCKEKIPFIYGIDYLKHDLPVGLLVPSENYQAFLKYFIYLKACKYQLKVVICDDIPALRLAVRRIYPKAKIQLCHNHYLENIRTNLCIRTNEKYRDFVSELGQALQKNLSWKKRMIELRRIWEVHAKHNQVLQHIMAGIVKKQEELFAFTKIGHCPRTNNLIECLNSHIEGRLKTIKGFKSSRAAERWLNAWLIRRRTKPFTDCGGQFRKFNGRIPLQITIKKQATLPDIVKSQEPKT